jgi:DNA-binding PucR family transcriptional regulator
VPVAAGRVDHQAHVDALVAPAVEKVAPVEHRAARDAGVGAPLLGEYLPTMLETARSGRRLTRSALEVFRRQGEAAADQGIALAALLDLYLSATWRLWSVIGSHADSASPAAVAIVAAGMFRAADDVAAALAEGYERAQWRTVRFEESLRREFVDDLLGGTSDPESLREPAGRLGFNLAGVHHVVVARTGRRLVDTDPILSQIDAYILRTFGSRDVIAATKDGTLVCVLPGEGAEAEAGLVATLEQAGDGPWRLGVGRPATGPGGVVASYGEARETLDLEARLNRGVTVARFDHVLPYRVLSADSALAAEMVDHVLGPLGSARGGGQHLIETLEAHFASSGNLSATARALHLSARAVAYRLERIGTLTGYSPQIPDDRFVLEMAIRTRSLIEK